MVMRILTAVTLLLLLYVPASRAQERGYAGPSELKGLRRVYVDAGEKNRARIAEELRKAKVGIEVVDAPERAELILLFSAEKLSTPTGVQTPPGDPELRYHDKPEVTYSNIEYTFGSAYIPAVGGGRRVLFIWEGKKKFLKSSVETFTSAFVREYKKANALK